MTDGWTNKRRRDIFNFLVKSPKGTVLLKSIEKTCKMLEDIVEEMGEENVVQIVIDNAANRHLQAAGYLLNPELHHSPNF